MIAMMFATVAFSVDAMLPALPAMTEELGLAEPGRAPLIITVFMGGLGLGTLVAGPLSDALGRKPVFYIGLAVYLSGAAMAGLSQSFEWMLVWRFVQGLGAAGPRIVSVAIIRDLFHGREMARIMSLTLMIFLIVPALAPAMGALIAEFFHWRMIFTAFVGFGLIMGLWFSLRIEETLPPDARRRLSVAGLTGALREMFGMRLFQISLTVQTLVMTTLFGVLTMVQPIFDQTFGKDDSFPYWFGAIALLSGVSSLLNASLVGRFGMRRLVTAAMVAQVVMSTVALILIWEPSPISFAVYVVWQFGVLFQAGMTVANLNAIAMQPLGHIAGFAASVLSAISTICAAALASPLGLFFDGTPRPLIISALVLTCLAMILMLRMRSFDPD